MMNCRTIRQFLEGAMTDFFVWKVKDVDVRVTCRFKPE